MISITNNFKTVEMTDGCKLYTTDEKTFTQVNADGEIVSMIQPGDKKWREALMTVATLSEAPADAKFAPFTPIKIGGRKQLTRVS